MNEIIARLRAAGLSARKDLGQHWLVDQQVVEDMITAAQLRGDETAVEVGPGPGVMTPALAVAAGQVVAIELDERMLTELRVGVDGLPNVEVRQGDVLQVDPASLPQPYVIVANVPYYITSAIIRHFLETVVRPQAMTLLVQAEVAERIAAAPPKMSVLAVSVQLYGRPSIVRYVESSSFYPPPEVRSAILRIEQIGEGLEERLGGLTEAQFFKVVRAGFAEKRKQLHNCLARHLDLSHDDAIALLERVAIDAKRRAETLTVAEWVHLGHAFYSR